MKPRRLSFGEGICAATLLGTACLGVAPSLSDSAATEFIDPTSIHVLAFGACPPWLPEIKVCRHNVVQFADAARESMGVPADQITTLINQYATADGVRTALAELRISTSEDSTLVIYYVGHGMLTPQTGKTSSQAEESLLLWSNSFPFAALYAVQAGIWMTASELVRLIDALPSDSTLVILDTCDAAGADDAVFSGRSRPKSKQVALMSSSRAHEIAFADITSAVFTRNLVEAMHSTSTMHESFIEAQQDTEAEAVLRCEAAMVSGALGEACTPQDPTLVDPTGLTQRIRVGGN